MVPKFRRISEFHLGVFGARVWGNDGIGFGFFWSLNSGAESCGAEEEVVGGGRGGEGTSCRGVRGGGENI